MLIQFVTLPLHLLIVSQTYDWAPNSLSGIATATNVSFFLNFLALHVYLAYVTKEPYRFKLTGQSFRKLKRSVKEYVKLGVPSVLMTYFDFWIYTVLLFLAS